MTCATPPATVTHSATAACSVHAQQRALTLRVRTQLEMENDDVIAAMLEQVGGH